MGSILCLTSALVDVGGQRHDLAALPPGKTRYTFYRKLVGPQGWSKRVRKISPPPGFDSWTVQQVAIPTELSRPSCKSVTFAVSSYDAHIYRVHLTMSSYDAHIYRVHLTMSSYDAHIYRVHLTNTKTPDRRRTAPKQKMTAKIRISRTSRQGDRCHLKSGLDLDLDLVLRGLIRDSQLFLSLESTSVIRNVLA
jgi:hypothetical protein